jgi:hypothetical protein
MSEINVMPFVDVMLVLLIIFMVTAPITARLIDHLSISRLGGPAMTVAIHLHVSPTPKRDKKRTRR